MRTSLLLTAVVLLLPGASARADSNGLVVDVQGQYATIDLGTEAGLVEGAHIAVFTEVVVDLDDGEPSTTLTRVATGEVTAVSARRARVRFGMNETVTVGMQASVTDGALSRSLVAPSETSARTEVSVASRLAVVVNGVGGGMLLEGHVDRKLGALTFMRVRLDPSGVVGYRLSDPDDDGPTPHPAPSFAPTTSLVALLGIDMRYVALGLGAGITQSTRLDEQFTPCEGCPYEARHHGFEAGLTIAMMGRFGARDGLHLDLDMAFVVVRERIETSRFGAALQIPVTPSLFVVARGSSGFGVVGTHTADVGARMLIRGDGTEGSSFVTPFVGYTAVAERATLRTHPGGQPRPREPVMVSGIALGVRFDHRF
jgi:hypothetical protein